MGIIEDKVVKDIRAFYKGCWPLVRLVRTKDWVMGGIRHCKGYFLEGWPFYNPRLDAWRYAHFLLGIRDLRTGRMKGIALGNWLYWEDRTQPIGKG